MVNIYRVRTVFEGVAGAPYYSNLYFQTGGSTINQVHDAVVLFWNGGKAELASPMTATVEGEVVTIDATTGDIVESQSRAPYTIGCTNVSPKLPPANQLLINWKSGSYLGGREVRGKLFVPQMTEAANTAFGTVEAATQSGWLGRANALINDPATALVVWSKKYGEVRAVTAANVGTQWAILRSRRD